MPALQFFVRLQTQWRIGPMGHRIGLDYPGVQAAATMAAVELTPALFEDLQLLEMATINEIADKYGKR